MLYLDPSGDLANNGPQPIIESSWEHHLSFNALRGVMGLGTLKLWGMLQG